MNESNFASLSSGLLARKGGAKPAMRPQVGILPLDGAAAHNLEDLGWNDMGDDEPASPRDGTVLQLTPEPANAAAAAEARKQDRQAEAELAHQTARKPVVVEQQEAIAAHIADQAVPEREIRAEAPQSKPVIRVSTPRPRRNALSLGKRAAFTLRLDSERHLKLRLASTLRNRSAQQLVTDALDQLLGAMPDVTDLARHAKQTD